MSPAMDWGQILAANGIPEPPGRAEAIAAIKAARAAKAAAKAAQDDSKAAKGFGRKPKA